MEEILHVRADMQTPACRHGSAGQRSLPRTVFHGVCMAKISYYYLLFPPLHAYIHTDYSDSNKMKWNWIWKQIVRLVRHQADSSFQKSRSRMDGLYGQTRNAAIEWQRAAPGCAEPVAGPWWWWSVPLHELGAGPGVAERLEQIRSHRPGLHRRVSPLVALWSRACVLTSLNLVKGQWSAVQTARCMDSRDSGGGISWFPGCSLIL